MNARVTTSHALARLLDTLDSRENFAVALATWSDEIQSLCAKEMRSAIDFQHLTERLGATSSRVARALSTHQALADRREAEQWLYAQLSTRCLIYLAHLEYLERSRALLTARKK